MSLRTSLLLLLIFVSSCQQEDAKIAVIDIDRAGNQVQSMRLSEVADSVYYTRLSTPDSVLLTDNINVQLSPHYLLLKDIGTQAVFLFTHEGRFLTRISGKGTDEQQYGFLSDAVLDETNQRIFILDADRQRVQAHNLQGAFLYAFPIENKPLRLALMPGKKLLLFTPPGGKDILRYPHVYLYDYEGKMLGSHFLPEKLEHQEYMGLTVLYNVGERVHLWETGADTINTFNDQAALIPTYALYSKILMPLEHRFNRELFKTGQKEYRQVLKMFETDRYVLIDALLEGKRNALVYDKASTDGFRLNYQDSAFGNLALGFANDLDGGLPFWPKEQVNEQYLYTIIRPAAFLKIMADSSIKKQTPVNPALHQRLLDLTQQLKEFDNPVIQVVRMK